MKFFKSPLFIFPAAGLIIATLLHAADVRIKDIATTSTVPNSDDYVATDGTTSGTRKIKPINFLTGTSGGVVFFNASNTMATSAALASTNLVVGGGAGVAPSTVAVIFASNTLTVGASGSGNIVGNVITANNTTVSTVTATNITLTEPVPGASGGTGVGNDGKTITLGGNLTTSGAYASTFTMTAATGVTFPTTGTLATLAGTETFTNKTFDANATGNVFKAYGYLQLTHPTVFASGTTQQTTVTDRRYGQALFGHGTDKATNYVEYVLTVPDDIDTSVDLTAVFHFVLGGADTGDFEYEISMIDVPASSVYDTAPADAVSLAFTADGSGANKDVQKTTSTTLTGWASALTAGSVWYIRVARDGDHANDTSTVNSYSGPLVIRYGKTQ